MDDKTIIQHYWDRDETALTETDEKYGRFCSSIADNILKNREDTKECLNDTYLKTWNTIPTQRPEIFPAFLGKIVRNLARIEYKNFFMNNIYFMKPHSFRSHLQKRSSLRTLENKVIYYMVLLQEVNQKTDIVSCLASSTILDETIFLIRH